VIKFIEKLDVTVVVPFYNRSSFTERLLISIFNQNALPQTILFIDNGSSFQECTRCMEMLSRFFCFEVEIKFLSTLKSGNANYARQLGLELAKSKYVAYLDSDDWWEPGHLISAVNTLEKSSKVGYYCGANIHRGHVEIRNACAVDDYQTVFDFLLIYKKIAQTSSYVVVREKMLGHKIIWDPSLKRNQDYDFFLSLHMYGGGWCFSEKALTNIDWDDGGAGSKIDFKSMIRFIHKWEHAMSKVILLKYLKSSLSELVARGAKIKYIKYYMCRINYLCGGVRSCALFLSIKYLAIGVVKRMVINFKLVKLIYWMRLEVYKFNK
jgi:glycosyltransferase involved in cell wall biosynthesis